MATTGRIGAMPITDRTRQFVRLTCLAALALKMISWPLWTGRSGLPLIPVFDFLEAVPVKVHSTFAMGSFLLLILLFFRPASRLVLGLLVASELFLCLLDQARWQPWEYQLLLTFSFLLLVDNRRFLQLSAFLLGATYIFAGLHKLHPAFLHLVWDAVVVKPMFGVTKTEAAYPLLHRAGVAVALFETAIGLALLFARRKRNAIIGALCIQAAILLFVGPWATGKNTILVAWNLWMAASVLLLFPHDEKWTLSWKRLPEATAIVLLGLMPIAGFFGWWPRYLSFDLYTGKAPYLLMEARRLPASIRSLRSEAFSKKGETEAVWWHDITSAKTGAMPYPEPDYYRKLVKKWRRSHPRETVVFEEGCYPFGPSDFTEVK